MRTLYHAVMPVNLEYYSSIFTDGLQVCSGRILKKTQIINEARENFFAICRDHKNFLIICMLFVASYMKR